MAVTKGEHGAACRHRGWTQGSGQQWWAATPLPLRGLTTAAFFISAPSPSSRCRAAPSPSTWWMALLRLLHAAAVGLMGHYVPTVCLPGDTSKIEAIGGEKKKILT